MATVKAHLAAFHERAAANHVARAKFHKNMAKCFSKLAGGLRKDSKADMEDENPLTDEQRQALLDMALAHNEMSDEDTDAAEFNLEACKACMKASDIGDLSKAVGMGASDGIVPDGVSAVIPAPAVRAVPRYGAPEIEKANIPLIFEKLVSTD